MALPELLANSPIPGIREMLTTLKSELPNEGAATIELEAELPAALHGPGQTRLLIGSEIMLVEAKSGTTITVLERAAEGSTKAAHTAGSSVYQIITAAGLKLYAQGVLTGKSPVTVNGSVIEIEKEKIIAENIASEAVSTTKIAATAVTEAKLSGESVTENKIQNKAVSAQKLANPTALPAKGAAGSVTVGTTSPGHKVTAVLVGKTAQTEFKIKHLLKTKAIIIGVAEGESEPEDILTGYKVKVNTTEEITIAFSVAPTEGAYILITILG